jgi:holo-[acyl-carrier-protein] synthase
MILGLGVDLVEVARFRRAVARQGDHFLQGFLRPAEIERFRLASDPFPLYALAFATKEALFKALGTGRSGPVRWHDVEVGGRMDGALCVSAGAFEGAEDADLRLCGGTADTLRAVRAERIHLARTLVRGRSGPDLAVAWAVLEGPDS